MSFDADEIPTPSGWARVEAQQGTTGAAASDVRMDVLYRFVTRVPPVPAEVTALALVLKKRRGLA